MCIPYPKKLKISTINFTLELCFTKLYIYLSFHFTINTKAGILKSTSHNFDLGIQFYTQEDDET